MDCARVLRDFSTIVSSSSLSFRIAYPGGFLVVKNNGLPFMSIVYSLHIEVLET